MCAICGRPFESSAALEAIEPLCLDCHEDAFAFDRARSYGVYDGALAAAIKLLKYEAVTRLGDWFAARLEEVIRREFGAMRFDAVVPVPLHRARQRERGYNQAALIARPLARRLSAKLGQYLLVRKKPRPPRLLLTEHERWESARGAYDTNKGVQVDKQRILLVDDVITTGATLHSCAKALREAGAAAVYAVAVARVVPGLLSRRSSEAASASKSLETVRTGFDGQPAQERVASEAQD